LTGQLACNVAILKSPPPFDRPPAGGAQDHCVDRVDRRAEV